MWNKKLKTLPNELEGRGIGSINCTKRSETGKGEVKGKRSMNKRKKSKIYNSKRIKEK